MITQASYDCLQAMQHDKADTLLPEVVRTKHANRTASTRNLCTSFRTSGLNMTVSLYPLGLRETHETEVRELVYGACGQPVYNLCNPLTKNFNNGKCQRVYIKKNGTQRQDLLQGELERTISRLHSLNFFANRKSQNSCGLPLRSWLSLTLLRMSRPNSEAHCVSAKRQK